jgi:1-deoxy-D-xylulose-5-phosphate reductoisomerase
MGPKITIDSATLMNKGLEVIEARWLFDRGPDRIDVLVHPQSIVHSMIELVDGSIIAQLGVTDMRHAIQYALTYPERKRGSLQPLDFTTMSNLTFEDPDAERFPCLRLAYQALEMGGTMPAVLNAANEIAVQAFLDGEIRLPEIPRIIESVMDEHELQTVSSLEIVLETDRWARGRAIMKLEKTASAI